MPDMDPEDIKAAIRKNGRTMASLALASGVHKQTLSLALRARVSSKSELVIADFLGMHPMDIWPSRYDRDGKRLTMVARKGAA